MKSIEKNILLEAEKFIRNSFKINASDKYCFHTLDHTIYVVEGVGIIGKESGLNDEELMLAEFCAWFHDVGYHKSHDKHEEISAKMAVEFLNSKGIRGEIEETVETSIMNTKVPANPNDNISKVLCDTDMRQLAEHAYEK